MADCAASKQNQGKQSKHHCQLGVNRTIQCLDDGVIYKCFIIQMAVETFIFPDAVKNNYGIMNSGQKQLWNHEQKIQSQ